MEGGGNEARCNEKSGDLCPLNRKRVYHVIWSWPGEDPASAVEEEKEGGQSLRSGPTHTKQNTVIGRPKKMITTKRIIGRG